jgi:hypothetical protein
VLVAGIGRWLVILLGDCVVHLTHGLPQRLSAWSYVSDFGAWFETHVERLIHGGLAHSNMIIDLTGTLELEIEPVKP